MVKAMIEKGYAFAILGNHEINLIAFNTKSKKGNYYLRERTNSKLRQCHASLDLILKENAKENMDFLKSLPLFVECNNFRAIHACWHKDSIKILKAVLTTDNTLTDDFFHLMYEEKSSLFDAMEKTLKGLELELPDKYAYLDKYGKKRTNCRYLWWDKNQDVESRIQIDKNDNINHNYGKYTDDKPVFFGHYWMSGTPRLTSNNAICLDFSVLADNHLYAYRFDNKELSEGNLIYV